MVGNNRGRPGCCTGGGRGKRTRLTEAHAHTKFIFRASISGPRLNRAKTPPEKLQTQQPRVGFGAKRTGTPRPETEPHVRLPLGC